MLGVRATEREPSQATAQVAVIGGRRVCALAIVMGAGL